MINLDINEFDHLKYLAHVNLLHQLNSKPTEQLLTDIVSQHLGSFYYHNWAIFKTKNIMDLSLHAIQKRLLYLKLGGMCYEICELLFHALFYFGFDVQRIPTIVLNNYQIDLNRPSTHNILVVKIDNRNFLIDTGFGYNSIRQPLQVSFDKTQILISKLEEKYELQCLDNYYQFGMEIDGEIWPCYRFNKQSLVNFPEIINESDTIKNYHGLINYEGFMPIRDHIVKIGRVTPTGRIGCTYDPSCNKFQKIEFRYQEATLKKLYDNCDDFIADVYEIFNISLTKQQFQNK